MDTAKWQEILKDTIKDDEYWVDINAKKKVDRFVRLELLQKIDTEITLDQLNFFNFEGPRKLNENGVCQIEGSCKVDFDIFKKEYSQLETHGFKTKYYFVIDEINRADLSKVFGELMYGLEESYRGINHSFSTQYKYLKTYEINEDGKAKKMQFDCFKDEFFIPPNLYIIGTMNDIDRSVEAFDFALRRRFEWISIKAKDVCEEVLLDIIKKVDKRKIKNLANKINNMNEVISTEGRQFGLSEDYHIGHVYFRNVNLNDGQSLQKIFNHNIVSILKEYTRGRDRDAVNDFIRNCADKLGVNYEL